MVADLNWVQPYFITFDRCIKNGESSDHASRNFNFCLCTGQVLSVYLIFRVMKVVFKKLLLNLSQGR